LRVELTNVAGCLRTRSANSVTATNVAARRCSCVNQWYVRQQWVRDLVAFQCNHWAEVCARLS